jgi:2-succinyl-5-enolpyruvyl-6-hydroxy-3-cyclohexene-1-carboxylate synthase
MTRDANTGFARTLVDEWARAGLTDACLAPGSRSAPLALALAADGRIRLHVHHDERSASFFALGAAKASGRPVIVLCTSGTAAANFHPAVLEAHHALVPLIVCTADRPPELRDTGAGQTVDQQKLYGDAVRWFADPGPPEDRPGVGAVWRSLAARAVAEAQGPPAGPVQLNLPFREPLVPTGAPLVDAPGRRDGEPWTRVARPVRAPGRDTVEQLAAAVRAAPRGVLVAGWGADVTEATATRFAAAAGWPILADPISNLRAGPLAVSTYDPLLRVPGYAVEHRPELVLRLGAPLTGKVANQWLDARVRQIVVDADTGWLDPTRAATRLVAADGELLLAAVTGELGDERPDDAWLEGWLRAERTARKTIDELLDTDDTMFEGRVARDVVAALPEGTSLVVASSMPVRDVESFAAPRAGVRFLANRGVNGIDGFVSTAFGVAAASTEPVVALLGDLCFLHDANGLLGAASRGLDAIFVVVDNDGGGVFSFLPQADLPEHFETLFGTPHHVDLAALARLHALPVEEVSSPAALTGAVQAAVAGGGVRVVLVRTNRASNVTRHRELWTAVARAIDGSGSR